MSANVALSETFDQWRVKTNELLVMTQTDGSSNFIKLSNSTDSTSNTTGSIITTGGIGVAKSMTIGNNLNVHGNIHANGNISADGTLTLGNETTDTINLAAYVSSDIIPNANVTHDLGTTALLWANVYVGAVDIVQKSDSNKPGLKITGNDASNRSLEIESSQVATDALYVNLASQTTGTGIHVNQDLNDGSTRSLVKINQQNAGGEGTTGLEVISANGRGIFIDSNSVAGGYTLEIDAEQTTTNTAKIASAATSGTILELEGEGVLTGTVLDITADSATSGKGINISMDGLTTGEAITVASTGTHSGNLVSLVSDGNATGTSLYVRNDSTTATTPVIQFANSSSTVFRVDVSGDINAAGHIGSSNTGALLIPVGDTGARPGSASQGQVRFNSDDVLMEVYNGTSWVGVGSGSGGAANTIEVRVEGTISSLGDGVTNTVYVQVEANTTLTGTYGNRMTISGSDSNVANTFVVDTMVMYNGSSTTVNLTDIGSAERLGNDTLGSGAVQVTVGTPANINSTAFEIPVSFKNTDSGNAKTNVPWKIVTKVYGDTALANIYSSYTT